MCFSNKITVVSFFTFLPSFYILFCLFFLFQKTFTRFFYLYFYLIFSSSILSYLNILSQLDFSENIFKQQSTTIQLMSFAISYFSFCVDVVLFKLPQHSACVLLSLLSLHFVIPSVSMWVVYNFSFYAAEDNTNKIKRTFILFLTA